MKFKLAVDGKILEVEVQNDFKVIIEDIAPDSYPELDLHHTYTHEGFIADAIWNNPGPNGNPIAGSSALIYEDHIDNLIP